MSDHDIDGLLLLLSDPHHSRYSTALRLLVAERDALKQRVDQLEMYQRVGRGSASDRDRDRDLRERLVCAALTGILAHEGRDREFDCVMDDAIWMADKALAAMRKGGGA